jgi:nucleoid-associated protein YgaU
VQRRGIRPAIASVLLLGAPIAGLIATRPAPTGRPSTWSADQIVRTACWALACACTVWLAITMLACVVTFVRVDAATAWRVAGDAPPIVRRVLQTVFAGAVAVAPLTSDTRPAPIRLHAGADGRLVEGQARIATTTSTSTSTTTSMSTTTSTTAPRASVPRPNPPVARSRPARPHPRRATVAPEHAHVVRAGDNLWSIARAEIVRVTGDARPSNVIIAAYWQRVIALNRATLRSGNPSLIFPGEIVALPTP